MQAIKRQKYVGIIPLTNHFWTSFKPQDTRGEKCLPVCLQNTYFSANRILTEVFDLYQSAND